MHLQIASRIRAENCRRSLCDSAARHEYDEKSGGVRYVILHRVTNMTVISTGNNMNQAVYTNTKMSQRNILF